MNENPTNSLEDWVRLPDITPEHVVQAQRIKHLLSGHLDSRLVTNPEFEGAEKVFLRAQLARIVHSTTLVPEGLWVKEEGDTNAVGITVNEEEKEEKSTADLNLHKNWVWVRPAFLNSGNLKSLKEEYDEDEIEQGKKEPLEKTEERLQKLDKDSAQWKICQQGLAEVHTQETKTAETTHTKQLS